MANTRSRRAARRAAMGTTEVVVILTVIAIAVIATVIQLGRQASRELAATAVGVGDPGQLTKHSRLGGEGIEPQLPASGSSSTTSSSQTGSDSSGTTGAGQSA
ncbi:MAG: hypothetical protein U1E05_20210, partial [Patescibacteria group bacterium]|nr:hypothetical protein [Patescibacteria group bacterium]